MGRAGRGGGEGEAGQGRLGGADWSRCEVGQGEVARVLNWVSNPPPLALESWRKGLEMALCWFVSSLMMALLKVESRSLVVMMVLLQKAASNNDTPSLSLPSGGPLGLKWSAVARGLDVAFDQHFVPAGAWEVCSGPKKVGKRGTMEEAGARPLGRPGSLQAGKQGCDQPGSGSLLQVCAWNPTQL